MKHPRLITPVLTDASRGKNHWYYPRMFRQRSGLHMARRVPALYNSVSSAEPAQIVTVRVTPLLCTEQRGTARCVRHSLQFTHPTVTNALKPRFK